MSSGCGDVLSLEDLKTAKKHQLFEAEVITGKQGGIAGGADIDFATNQVTGQTQKTMPAILRDLGFDPASFDFTSGGTLTISDRNKVVFDPVSMTWYSWAGSLPKVIPAGTNPLMDSSWKPQTDPSIREDLSGVNGFGYIGQVDSFANLRLLTPRFSGERVLLASYYAGGTVGGGEFVARSSVTPPADDGGLYAVVAAPWYWERVDKENVDVDGFGARPYTVPIDGSVPSGAVSSSDAFQRMLNSLNKVIAAGTYGVGYLIDTPVLMVDRYYSVIDHKQAVVHKTATTKTTFGDYIAAAGSYVEGNVNCVYFILRSRYWEIKNGYIDCHLAPSNDRPVAFYIPEAVGYKIERVLTRGCKNGIWAKSAWLGTLRLNRFSENTGHGVYYDSTRFTSTGASSGRMQTATSLSIISCYAAAAVGDGWHMESCQYMNFTSSAMDGAGSVAGGSSYYFDACDVAGDIGSETPSSSANAYLTLVGGSATLSMNVYDTVTTPNPVVLVSGGAAAELSLALRTQRTRLFTIQGTGSYVNVPLLTFWNGTTTTPPPSLVDTGSFLHIESARDTKGSLDYTDGQVQRSNGYTAAYQARPAALTPFTHKEARFGVPAGTTTVNIPLADLKEIFPNFNRGSNTFVEWLQISTRNGAGITYGAIFACTASAVLGAKLDAQIQTNNGSAQAVVSSITISGSNLVITYAGSIATDSIIMFKPV